VPRLRQSPTLLQRLFLLVGFALLPAALLLVGAVAALRAQHAEAARDQARRIADNAAARLERVIEGTRQTLLVLSESDAVRDAVRDGDPGVCAARLHGLGQRLPERIRVGVLDRGGRILCDTIGSPPGGGFGGAPGLHSLDAVLSSDSLAIAGFGPEPAESGAARTDGGAPLALHLALAVRRAPDEPPHGVVAAALGLPWIAAQLRPVGLPPGAELFLLDREGDVVLRLRAHPASSDDLAPPRAGTETAETLAALLALRPAVTPTDGTAPPPIAGGSGSGTVADTRLPYHSPRAALLRDAPGPDGTPRIYALAHEIAPAQGALHLVVSLDAAAALAPAAEVGRRWAVLLALGLVASFAAAGIGAQRFVLAPIRALQQTARHWARGEYGARATPALVAPPPEFARLAAALDRVAEAAEQRDRAAAALAEKEARLSLALEAGGLGAWEMDPRSGSVVRSPRHDALFGYPRPQTRWSYRRMLRHVLPEDRPRVEAAFRRAFAEAAPVRVECRIRTAGKGEARWLEASGAPHRGPDGRVKFLGVVADTTERRRTEERLRLVAGELNHRVKNTLAAVQSIAAQTLRWPAGDLPAAEAARAAFQSRLLALARSHELLTREGWTGADLAELATHALAPHAGARGGSGDAAPTRVTIAGPPVRLAPRCTVPLAMALHELATNAARHGALSRPEGRVTVLWSVRAAPAEGAAAGGVAGPAPGAEVLTLRWEESGGPPLAGPPTRRGFGTRLLERGLALELRGTVRLDFARDGLRCEVEAPLAVAGAPPGEEPEAAVRPAPCAPRRAAVGAAAAATG
jgi:PAS domain S-box-containing protein